MSIENNSTIHLFGTTVQTISQNSFMSLQNQKRFCSLKNRSHYLQQYHKRNDRKPKIALIQEGKKRRSTKYIVNESVSAEEQGLLRQFNNLVTSYYKIMGQDYESQTQEQVRFNQRLIILLGSELMNVLEKEISQQQHLDSENNEVKEEENLISDKEVQNEKKD